MKTNKRNSGSNAKFYIVLPTLESLLSTATTASLGQIMLTWNIPTL